MTRRDLAGDILQVHDSGSYPLERGTLAISAVFLLKNRIHAIDYALA
jgi:hypothetical protein